MRITTINFSEPALKGLKALVDSGLYPNRSEAVRVAVRDFLDKELQQLERISNITKEIKDEVGTKPKGYGSKEPPKLKITMADMRSGLSDDQIALINQNIDHELKMIKDGK
jgi:Arc/MetJ-type ribon-helix-helix transcriptional regulator